MTKKIPLRDQIKEAARELALRKNTFPRWVEANRMTQADADKKIAIQEAIVTSLTWLDSNSDLIKAAIAKMKGEAA